MSYSNLNYPNFNNSFLQDIDQDSYATFTRAKPDDKIFLKLDIQNPELLIYETYDYKNWLQENLLFSIPIYDVSRDNIFYTKTDSIKLERFLKSEGNTSVFKRKCINHSSRCQTCEIMSRQNHKKEGNLIATIWNNVTATQENT